MDRRSVVRRRRARRGSAVLVVLVALVAACQDDPGGGPAADDTLVRQVEATGLTLYLPELRDLRPDGVQVQDGVVVVPVTLDGTAGSDLRELPLPRGARPCTVLPRIADSTCTRTGDAVVSRMEELTTVGVVRGDTLVALTGLVTEADDTLADDALAALREAPVVSAEDLVAALG